MALDPRAVLLLLCCLRIVIDTYYLYPCAGDLVIDLCAAPHAYTTYGHTHWGMFHAASWMIKEDAPLVERT